MSLLPRTLYITCLETLSCSECVLPVRRTALSQQGRIKNRISNDFLIPNNRETIHDSLAKGHVSQGCLFSFPRKANILINVALATQRPPTSHSSLENALKSKHTKTPYRGNVQNKVLAYLAERGKPTKLNSYTSQIKGE